MRLEQLEQVVVLEKELSISKAAKVLYMTQPALSMSLTSLENELGIKLFERSSNGIKPTPEEQMLSCFVRGILQDMKRLEHLHEQYINIEQNASVAVVPELYDEVVMEVLRLQIEKPAPKIRVLSIPAEQILDSLYSGQCDLAILSCADSQRERMERQLRIKRIHYEVLRELPIQLCLRSDHPLASQEILTREDILKERVVFQKESTTVLRNYGLLAKVAHPNWLAVDDHEVLKKLVAEGYGLGLIQYVFLDYDPYFAQGPLLLRPLEGLEKSRSYLLYDRQRYPETFKKALLQNLQHSDEHQQPEDTSVC